MAVEFKFPDVGEGIKEGEIVKWLVKIGDIVKENQNIVQIETDKAVVDIPSPATGKILKINFKDGDKVNVGQVLVVIGKEGEKVSQSNKSPAVVGEIDSNASDLKFQHLEMKQSEFMKGIQQSSKIIASPVIRKLASEKGINLKNIKGSGQGGKIIKSDLIKGAVEKPSIPQQTIIVKKKFDNYGYLERIPLKGIRKTIAEHMLLSVKEAPQVTSMEDIDVSKLWIKRKKEKIILDKKAIKLTFLPYIIKATISALKENPILNSSLEGDEIILKKYFNIGIATETEVGLMVPVIKIAENKNLIQLAKEISSLAKKARTRKIDIMDLKGGTFTITNYGSVGGTYGAPIINYPESAILGLGRIFDRAILEKGKLKNVKILPVSVTFDHRILDGAQAARFLKSLKTFLENPDHLNLKMQ